MEHLEQIHPITDLPKRFEGVVSQLEAVFRDFPDLIFILDADGAILEYRASKRILFQLKSNQFIGKTFQDYLPEEISQEFNGVMIGIPECGELASIKVRMELADGDHWFDGRLASGSNHLVIVVLRDITEQEKIAQRNHQQLRQLSALHSIVAAITSSVDLKVTLSIILREAINLLSIDAADVLLVDQDDKRLKFAFGRGFRTISREQPPLRIGQGYAGIAALERRTISVSPINKNEVGFLHSPGFDKEDFVSYYAVPLIAKGQVKGVMEIYHRTPLKPSEEWFSYLSTLATQAAFAIDSAELFVSLQKKNSELTLASDAIIEAWSQGLEISGREDREHTSRVAEMSVALAQRMGIHKDDMIHIHRGALLHDIGMLGIPEHVLTKPGPLNDDEWRLVREHPITAFRMLSHQSFLQSALSIPHFHHERWNGSGYPDQLSKEQIPIFARIFAVVDVYDALSSHRPYRSALGKLETLQYIHDQSGTLFDPRIAAAFVSMMD